MKAKKISILTIVFLIFIFSGTSLSVMGRIVLPPPPPPNSEIKFVDVPTNYNTIEEGDSIIFEWKATTNLATDEYKITIGSTDVTGSWTSNSAVSYTISSSDLQVGNHQIYMRFYDEVTSIVDIVHLFVLPNLDTDGDGLTDYEETAYTKTPIDSAEDFTGPTVKVLVGFREGAAKVSLGNRLDSEGYGTISRRLYHSIQKSICTLTSNIVQIQRIDTIKVLQIDTWALTGYGSHGSVVYECMKGEIYSFHSDRWERDKYDIRYGTLLQGLLDAEAEGYDIICIALNGSFISDEKESINRLVEELGTIIIVGTGNDDKTTISGMAKYKHTIAIGAAWVSALNPDSIVDNSNYGEEMDFVCHSLGPINAPVCATSWATGYCSGYVINMLCANQNLDPVTLRDLMRQSAEKIEEQDHTYGEYPYVSASNYVWPDTYGWCDVFGYGYITKSNCHQSALDQLTEPY